MKLPYPPTDRIPVHIYLTNGIDGNGVPKVIREVKTKCTWNEEMRYIRDTDGKLVKLQASLFRKGDIAQDISELEGYIIIYGKKYNIYQSARPRQPNGEVHHTELMLQ